MLFVPPSRLIGSILQKIRGGQAEVISIVLNWPTLSW